MTVTHTLRTALLIGASTATAQSTNTTYNNTECVVDFYNGEFISNTSCTSLHYNESIPYNASTSLINGTFYLNYNLSSPGINSTYNESSGVLTYYNGTVLDYGVVLNITNSTNSSLVYNNGQTLNHTLFTIINETGTIQPTNISSTTSPANTSVPVTTAPAAGAFNTTNSSHIPVTVASTTVASTTAPATTNGSKPIVIGGGSTTAATTSAVTTALSTTSAPSTTAAATTTASTTTAATTVPATTTAAVTTLKPIATIPAQSNSSTEVIVVEVIEYINITVITTDQFGSGTQNVTAAPAPTAIPAQSPCPAATNITCGAGLLVCQVTDPGRLESPWAGSYCPHPQCYDPKVYVCDALTASETTTVAAGFLCPLSAPDVCGRACYSPYQYSCGVNTDNWYASQLLQPVQSVALAQSQSSSTNTLSYVSGIIPTGNFSIFNLFFDPTPASLVTYVIVHFQTVAEDNNVPQNQYIQDCTFDTRWQTQVYVPVGQGVTYSFTFGVQPRSAGVQYNTPVQFFINGVMTGGTNSTATPAPTTPATSAPTLPPSCPTDSTLSCPSTNKVCQVLDPGRSELPWANSPCPHPQCYDPTLYNCLTPPASPAQFLCPISAPLACGRACYSPYSYSCNVNYDNWLLSTLTQGTSNFKSGNDQVNYTCSVQPATNITIYTTTAPTTTAAPSTTTTVQQQVYNVQVEVDVTVVEYVTVIYQFLEQNATTYTLPQATNCTKTSNGYVLPISANPGSQCSYSLALATSTNVFNTLTNTFTAGSPYHSKSLVSTTTQAPSSSTATPTPTISTAATTTTSAMAALVLSSVIALIM